MIFFFRRKGCKGTSLSPHWSKHLLYIKFNQPPLGRLFAEYTPLYFSGVYPALQDTCDQLWFYTSLSHHRAVLPSLHRLHLPLSIITL